MPAPHCSQKKLREGKLSVVELSGSGRHSGTYRREGMKNMLASWGFSVLQPRKRTCGGFTRQMWNDTPQGVGDIHKNVQCEKRRAHVGEDAK